MPGNDEIGILFAFEFPMTYKYVSDDIVIITVLKLQSSVSKS